MLNRRDFLTALATLTGGLLVSPPSAKAKPAPPPDRLGQPLPQRRLGDTGETVTMLGLGGWHIGEMDQRQAEEAIETALAGGVRFFDTAESYQDGGSERHYGRFLTPKYREAVFLMTKSTAPDAATARKHLEGSLSRLKTEYLDLWQIHSLQDPQDTDDRLANGVLDEFLQAREQGKVRHIGFTGHHSPEAHQRMLEKTEQLEVCQMPINVLDPSHKSFIEHVLPRLTERKLGVLAMKTLANGYFFKMLERDGAPHGPVMPEHLKLEEALHFVWSLPVSVLISGVDSVDQLRQNIKLARSFTEMDAQARQELVRKVADLAGPEVEYYKA